MKKLFLFSLLSLFFTGIIGAKDGGQAPYTGYLFTYFINNSPEGEQLRFALSRDGFNWTPINCGEKVVDVDNVARWKCIRDPHILRCEDGKTFYMVMTDMKCTEGWSSNDGMILMKSTDLVNWTSTAIDFPTVWPETFDRDKLKRVWAPQTIYDREAGKYMVYYSMQEEGKPLSIYYSYANEDFTAITMPEKMYDVGFDILDADIIPTDTAYHMFLAGIWKVTAKNLKGPWSKLTKKRLQQTRRDAEGPGVFKFNGKDEYCLMYDCFRDGMYQFCSSKDLENFKLVAETKTQGAFTPRHGTVIGITEEEYQRLSKAFPNTPKFPIPVSEQQEKMQQGQFEPTWESLSQYQVPEWFRNVKFGIWAHWGAQCVEGSGDWMARELYIEGSGKYNHHRDNYGHPSEFGYKDVLPLFRAENWSPDSLVRFYKEVCGAEYFFALGNHHDNYDLWDSKYQEWNSMQIGPKRDILGEWAQAAKHYNLPFGISFHADHAWTWFETSRRFDMKGEKRGKLYDGWLTKEDGYIPNADGTEKWWKGLDPQKLYAQDHDMSKNTWNNGSINGQWGWQNGACPPSEEFVTNFYNRTLDAINRYNPDLLYFDVTVLPFYPLSDAGMKITAHMYNHHMQVSAAKTKEKKSVAKATPNPGVVFGKILENDQQKQSMVWDVERGAPNQIVPDPWQCCNCIGNWHYNTSVYQNNGYKSAATIAKLLVDIVSKNGNMLLSVPLRGDGTFDEKEEAIMREFGAWMQVNKESIIGTRPWKKFGEGPIAEQKIAINDQGFNDGAYIKADYRDIRFTQKGNIIYATPLSWPQDMQLIIKSLAGEKIKAVELLGYGKVEYTLTDEGLTLTLPSKVNSLMPVLKVTVK